MGWSCVAISRCVGSTGSCLLSLQSSVAMTALALPSMWRDIAQSLWRTFNWTLTVPPYRGAHKMIVYTGASIQDIRKAAMLQIISGRTQGAFWIQSLPVPMLRRFTRSLDDSQTWWCSVIWMGSVQLANEDLQTVEGNLKHHTSKGPIGSTEELSPANYKPCLRKRLR